MRTVSDELLSVTPVCSDCNPPWEGSNKAASLSVKPDWLMTSIRLMLWGDLEGSMSP